jgi:formate dehydrogenase subunit delta
MSGQTLDRLVYMANQIGREFASQRPHDAVDATWDHLWHFWDPRMRTMIVAHLHEGGAGLSEIARAAVAKLVDDAEPAPATRATEFNAPHQGASGAGSDAG